MTSKVDAHKIARAAAEGVAIALAAREAPPRFPFHIICGIPPEIFEVTLEASRELGVQVAGIKAQQIQKAG
jgi:hypothetical protein